MIILICNVVFLIILLYNNSGGYGMEINNRTLINVSEKDIVNGKCVIPDGVTTIGKYAFAHRKNLKFVDIPSSVTIIEQEAFLNCRDLESIVIPNSVTYIGHSAFQFCNNLKK